MPVNQKLMKALQMKYGKKRGTYVYYAMERSGHPATKVTDVKEHHRKGTLGVKNHKRRL